MNRREFLGCTANGMGAVALAQLLGQSQLLGQDLHPKAKAKRVLHLFMNGGASPMDTFDYKPELEKRHGQKFDPGAGVMENLTIWERDKDGHAEQAISAEMAYLVFGLGANGGVANATHLGGLLVGYIYLKGRRIDPLAELKYRYLKWKINRVRKKFDVYSGGRADDWDRRVH